MKRAGYTSAPCHGCGTTALHLKDKVCSTCATNLKMFAQINEEVAATEDRVLLSMQERDYALPYMRHEDNCEIRTPLHELSMLLSEPTTERVKTYDNAKHKHIEEAYLWDFNLGVDRRGEWSITRRINPVVARLLRQVQVACTKALERAYSEGAANGRDLLMGLASGKITNDEFNEQAARLDKEGRR